MIKPMQIKKIMLFVVLMMLPLSASAEWLEDIFKAALKIYGINVEMKDLDRNQLTQLNNINDSLTGTHNYGSQYYNANQFGWGQDSSNWQLLLAQAARGGGNGEVGHAMNQLSPQFPIRSSLGSSNETQNEYYRLQAQTTLASRATSQTAFEQLNREADTLQNLHNLIDRAPDSKSAADINNRLAAENALINIQQAKLLAVLVQQAAIDSQARANTAKENAEFFDKR